jgi:hypothetical protein
MYLQFRANLPTPEREDIGNYIISKKYTKLLLTIVPTPHLS